MASFSSVLGLKLNAPSDPFLLSDFIGNFEILDGAPGAFICTSLTRPSWGASQAGRTIFMTDLKYESYWDGSAWQDMRQAAPVFFGGVYLSTSLARNTSPTFTVLTFTTSRPCAMMCQIIATYQCNNQNSQDAFQSILFDGTKSTVGGYREQIRFEGNSSDAGGAAGQVCTSMTIIPSVTAAQHQIGIQVDMGSYSTPITLVGVKAMGLISLYQSGNSL